jgi:Rrf2 family cysteine metabolism transcriptional repressor
MKLTTKGRYGLRVMLELAMNQGGGPMLVETIAKKQDISPNYIHVLVTALRNAGMVRTIRGPNGGYELGQHPQNITILKIIEALEGKQTWVECVDDACACPKAPSCAARDLWREVIGSVEGLLSSRTLADLAEQQRAKQEAHLMYYI